MRASERGQRIIEWAEHMYSGDLTETVADIIADLLHAYHDGRDTDNDPEPEEIVFVALDHYEHERSLV